MIDTALLLLKAGNVVRHLKRVREKCDPDLEAFLADRDHQDIVCFNLQMAIQNCIDMAAHIMSEEGTSVPGSISEMFYFLQEKGLLPSHLVERMVMAVGFRNLLVHEYGRLDLEEVFHIAHHHTQDLNHYLATLFDKLGIDAPSEGGSGGGTF